MTQTIRAISLWQPWASLVALGLKQYETRHWMTDYQGPLAIHAAKRWTKGQEDVLVDLARRFERIREAFVFDGTLRPLPLGHIVCVGYLTDVKLTQWVYPYTTWDMPERQMEIAVGDWTPGRYAWKLEDVQRFEEPIPARGAQGFWNWQVPDGVRIHAH